MQFNRLIAIGGSYALAVGTAGAIMSLYYAAIFLGDTPRAALSINALPGMAALFAIAVAATFLMGACAFLPASLLIAASEIWRIRHPAFYAVTAALISVAVPLLPLFPGKGDVAGLVSSSSLVSAIAGLVAGVVYWSHAGRHAGSTD